MKLVESRLNCVRPSGLRVKNVCFDRMTALSVT